MNRKIVITGASRGIGKAIAQKFALEKSDVALCARSAADLNRLKNELQELGGRVLAVGCDVRNQEEIIEFGRKTLAFFGGAPDVLIHNAGVFLPGRIIDEPEGNLEQLMETNLYSAYHLSRILVPEMIARKSGHVFFISSVAGLQAYANGGSYSISKFAMTGLAKALREELKPHDVKVTTLFPGATLTDSWSGTDLPADRFMTAEDLAQNIWDIYKLSPQTVVEEVILRPMKGDI